jgi:hypothetical protein
MAPKKLNFITGNRGKLAETKAILGDIVDLRSQSLDLPELQGTIEEISADKCRRAAEAVRFPRKISAVLNIWLRYHRSMVQFWLRIHVYVSMHLKSSLVHICRFNLLEFEFRVGG